MTLSIIERALAKSKRMAASQGKDRSRDHGGTVGVAPEEASLDRVGRKPATESLPSRPNQSETLASPARGASAKTSSRPETRGLSAVPGSTETSVDDVSVDTLEQRLGDWLVQRQRLSELDLARVRRVRQEQATGEGLPRLLVSLGMVSELDIAKGLSEIFHLPLAGAVDYDAATALSEGTVTTRFLKQHRIIPVMEDGKRIILAMADPSDDYAVSATALASGRPVGRWVGLPSEIDAAIERLYGGGRSQMGQILAETGSSESISEEDVQLLKDMASEAPVIRLVNLLLNRAAESGASDIHVEPFENQIKIRYRIDGVLRKAESPPLKLSPAIISRIKIMAKLNIAERRLPQDGRIKMRAQGKELDIRVSTVPTMHGESVVMRLLNRGDVVLELQGLGFSEDTLERFRDVLAMPHGMILVTGPTGSGKTTTLYTALNILNTEERKIITAEDPVEYQLEGINQIQVKSAIDLTFANALRSIVRQDPDVIMVGELRDRETAQICVQSALTGHLVFSTLHTNDAASSISRLLDMGVEDYLLTSTLNAVIGQRLVRVLCPHCREPYEPLPELVEKAELATLTDDRPILLFRPVGCEQCSGTGYRGRTAVHELLLMSDAIRGLVLKRTDAKQIQALARQEGMCTMYKDGCMKALKGITTLEEVARIIQEA